MRPLAKKALFTSIAVLFAVTLDTYSHVISGLQQDAVKRLDAVLQPELSQVQDVSILLAKANYIYLKEVF